MAELATPSTPFSNGTEERAWMSKWCNFCANDHDMHLDNGGGCELVMDYMVGVGTPEWRWPEAWLPEPDDGRFFLPSRMTCGMFRPCEPCGGDPGADDRAERMAEVADYWMKRATT